MHTESPGHPLNVCAYGPHRASGTQALSCYKYQWVWQMCVWCFLLGRREQDTRCVGDLNNYICWCIHLIGWRYSNVNTFSGSLILIYPNNPRYIMQYIYIHIYDIYIHVYDICVKHKKTWDSKCLAQIAQMVRAFGMNPNGWGFKSPSCGNIFCLKNFNTNIHSWVVALADLAFQMVNSLQTFGGEVKQLITGNLSHSGNTSLSNICGALRPRLKTPFVAVPFNEINPNMFG